MKHSALKFIFLAAVSLPHIGLNGQIMVNFTGETAVPLPAIPQAVAADPSGKPYFYLAAKAGGLQVYDIQDVAQPKWVKTVPITQFGGLEVMNVHMRGNLLYLALGNFFGNNGQKPGLAILDVSDPLNPLIKDVWEWVTEDRGSASATVSGDYAYLAAMSQGMIILSIANPGDIQFVSQIIPDPDFPLPNPPAPQVPNARGIAVRNDVAFLCYDAGGLRVINVADKMHPVETGRYINTTPFSPPGKPQAFNNIILDGTKAYVAADYCGMEVLDISDTAHIVQQSWWNPWQCQSITNLWAGSPGHTNQMALDTAAQLVFLSSAQSELSIVDVSDPAQPKLAGGYGTTDNNLGTWGMTLDGQRIFLVYIVAAIPFGSNWAGVKILEWEKTDGTEESAVFMANRLYPNPFSHELNVRFELQEAMVLYLDLFDIRGKKVANLAEGYFPAGPQQFAWKGSVPNGLYTIRLTTAHGSRVWMMLKN